MTNLWLGLSFDDSASSEYDLDDSNATSSTIYGTSYGIDFVLERYVNCLPRQDGCDSD